jgi:hypothetical protein
MIDSSKDKNIKTIKQGRDLHVCVDLNKLETILLKTGIGKKQDIFS